MPIRFTSPSLGGHYESHLRAKEWEVGLFYRRLTADQWFVNDEIREDLAPFGGQSPRFNINSVDLAVTYGLSDRLSLRLTLPFSTGTLSKIHPDSNRHTTSATGLGDINLVGNFWLFKPSSHANGNVGVGVGVKAPTGNHHVEDDLFRPNDTIRFAVDQPIQLGDGGWGIVLQTQGFQRLFGNGYGYFSGSYQLSPKERTDARFGPTSALTWAVPDVYSARMGRAYAVWPIGGVSVSFGGRIDGTPVHD